MKAKCLLFNAIFLFSVMQVTAQSGTLDSSFNNTGKDLTDIGNSADKAFAVAVQPDGKIIVGGSSMIQPMQVNFSLVRLNVDGSLDNTFGNQGVASHWFGPAGGGNDDVIESIALQPDGKILATGRSIGSLGGKTPVVRWNADGTLDLQFGLNGIAYANGINWGYDIALQSDGKILVTGESFDTTYNEGVFGVVRLNVDGTPDSTFDDDGLMQAAVAYDFFYDKSNSIAVNSSGKIIVAGNSFNGTNTLFAVMQFNTDGSLDSTFSDDGITTTQIVAGNQEANAVMIQPDGKIIAGGSANSNTYQNFAIVRYNVDGSIDTTLDGDGADTTDVGPFDDYIYDLSFSATGKIIATGITQDFHSPFSLVSYLSNGAVDSSFGINGIQKIDFGLTNAYASAIAISDAGKIAVAGYSSPDAYTFRYAVSLSDSTGQPDVNFNGTGKLELNLGLGSDMLTAMKLESDGKIISCGNSNNGNGFHLSFSRLNDDGSADVSFNGTGFLVENFGDYATCFAEQADGKYLAGIDYAFNLYRFNHDGSIDSTFGTNGTAWASDFYSGVSTAGIKAIVIQPDGKIIAAGYCGPWPMVDKDFALARFNEDGSLDSSFGIDGKQVTNLSFNQYDEIRAVALQQDGKIVATGLANYYFGTARYSSNGMLDNTFGTGGIVTTIIGTPWSDVANALAIQSDGKIIVTGTTQQNPYYKVATVRYLTNGNLDNSFGNGGKIITDFGDDWCESMATAIQSDGKIIVGCSSGSFDPANPPPLADFALIRLDTDGTPDSTFGLSGKIKTDFKGGNDELRSMFIQPDGKIVAGGFADNGTDYDFALSRYLVVLDIGIIDPKENNAEVLIYPNPINEFTTLEYELATSDVVSVYITDMQGKVLQMLSDQENKNTGKHVQPIIFNENFASGLYQLTIKTNSGLVYVKIVKR